MKTEIFQNDLLSENWTNIENKVIKPMWNKYKHGYESIKFDYNDFLSLAGIELTKAFKKFDPKKSNIYTYATNVISRKAQMEIRDWRDRNVRKIMASAISIDTPIPNKNCFLKDIIEQDFISEYDEGLKEKFLEDIIINALHRKKEKQLIRLFSEGYTIKEISLKLNVPDMWTRDMLNSIGKRTQIRAIARDYGYDI